MRPLRRSRRSKEFQYLENSIQEESPPPIPPLTLEQEKLWKICRLGDRALLDEFLLNNPTVNLDCKNAQGSTLLTEAATKMAQFPDIVEVLLNSGAGIDVADELGNTPLHNAVLYFPSTQKTVDMLLERGANVGAKNHEGHTPVKLAEDKDLKDALKMLVKTLKSKAFNAVSRTYSNSPEIKRKVYDRNAIKNQSISVIHSSPVATNKPGLLKKRKREEDDDPDVSFSSSVKRIKWGHRLDDPIYETDLTNAHNDSIVENPSENVHIQSWNVCDSFKIADTNSLNSNHETGSYSKYNDRNKDVPLTVAGDVSEKVVASKIGSLNLESDEIRTVSDLPKTNRVNFDQGFGIFVL